MEEFNFRFINDLLHFFRVKSDSRYQSNLNEIDKSEHKSSEEGTKGFVFPPEVPANGCEYGSVILALCQWHVLKLVLATERGDSDSENK